MELYLRWLEAHEMELGEEQHLGLLFCTEGGDEQIELLQRQIHKGLEAARQRWENHPYN